jgi:dTDP-4-dehydrorhamnose 3,5-epimerase
MKITPTAIPEVCVIEPVVHGDPRGFFFEHFRADLFANAGLASVYTQDNVSLSRHGVLRGLHLQNPFAQAKLVSVLRGEVFDVAVDVRVGSPTFGRWVGETLSSDTKRMLYVPPGFAHGFLVLSDEALFAYKCTEYYHPESELTIRWDDPEIGIEWPMRDVILAPRDAAAPALGAVAPGALPVYRQASSRRG